MATASAGPYASLHLAADRQPRQHPTTQFFTGRMPFLPSNQRRQSTDNISLHCTDSQKHDNAFQQLHTHGTNGKQYPGRKISVDVTPAILVTFSCSDLSRTRVCLTFKLKLDNRLFITFADLSSRVVSASDCGLREPRFESRR